jgi:pyridoxamine 5'-phosphate oxidase
MSQAPLPGDGPMLPEPLPSDPFPLFLAWFEEAAAARTQPNPNSFTLATIDADGRPSARIVLCKAVDVVGGSISFFTNYTSRKSRALVAHPWAAAVFHWDTLGKQARLEGPVARVSERESDVYFASRPWQSRIGSWASQQSEPIGSRQALIDKVHAAMRRFGLDPANPPADGARVDIPRPPHWGGWRMVAARVELWVSGVGRVHDRAVWERPVETGGPGPRTMGWSETRLQP